MNDTHLKWLIKLVQDRYKWLALTPKQAELIHKYEEHISGFSDSYYPSMWEEKEIESYFFRNALTTKQFKIYQRKVTRQLKDVESEMIKNDKKRRKEIEEQRTLLQSYKKEAVPKILKHKKENFIGKSPSIRRKIDFLKDQYNDYLKERLKGIIVSHFRYSRNLEPNLFHLELIRHEMEKVLPSYYFFDKTSDKADKEIGNQLFHKMKYELTLFREFCQNDLNAGSQITNVPQSQEATLPGFVIQLGGERSDEEKEKDEFLSYLLVDSEKYRWQEGI